MNVFAPVAVWGFWILLVVGWWLDEIGIKASTIFVVLWIAGYAGSRFLFPGIWFLPFVALLDIALVLAVFKADVRLR